MPRIHHLIHPADGSKLPVIIPQRAVWKMLREGKEEQHEAREDRP